MSSPQVRNQPASMAEGRITGDANPNTTQPICKHPLLSQQNKTHTPPCPILAKKQTKARLRLVLKAPEARSELPPSNQPKSIRKRKRNDNEQATNPPRKSKRAQIKKDTQPHVTDEDFRTSASLDQSSIQPVGSRVGNVQLTETEYVRMFTWSWHRASSRPKVHEEYGLESPSGTKFEEFE